MYKFYLLLFIAFNTFFKFEKNKRATLGNTITKGLQTVPELCLDSIRMTNSKHEVNFTYTLSQKRHTIIIDAKLENTGNDSVYFLNISCDGTQYFLRYDTSKYQLSPFIFCNRSYSYATKIPPKGAFYFRARFESKIKEKDIKLGFNFIEIKNFPELSKYHLKCSNGSKTPGKLIDGFLKKGKISRHQSGW